MVLVETEGQRWLSVMGPQRAEVQRMCARACVHEELTRGSSIPSCKQRLSVTSVQRQDPFPENWERLDHLRCMKSFKVALNGEVLYVTVA
jgi:hypothetical protein